MEKLTDVSNLEGFSVMLMNHMSGSLRDNDCDNTPCPPQGLQSFVQLPLVVNRSTPWRSRIENNPLVVFKGSAPQREKSGCPMQTARQYMKVTSIVWLDLWEVRMSARLIMFASSRSYDGVGLCKWKIISEESQRI